MKNTNVLEHPLDHVPVEHDVVLAPSELEVGRAVAEGVVDLDDLGVEFGPGEVAPPLSVVGPDAVFEDEAHAHVFAEKVVDLATRFDGHIDSSHINKIVSCLIKLYDPFEVMNVGPENTPPIVHNIISL